MNRTFALVRNRGERRIEAERPVDANVLDPEAFAAIYQRHLPGIYGYLLAHTRREEDACDLAQQVFTQALAALPRYRQREIPISVWLFRIARNLAVDLHRRRHPTVSWELLPDTLHPVAADDVEATVIRHEAAAHLLTVLDRLEPEKRELLILRFAGGLKVREIASLLGRSEAAVRSELRRVLQALQEHVPYD
jgi:RNA polymerase sigma-70 factor (ECF subfamily)